VTSRSNTMTSARRDLESRYAAAVFQRQRNAARAFGRAFLFCDGSG
jgi:hypothetical protein